MNVITMPQLGETVTEGTIIAWSVGVGDRVAVDDTLFEVSTEKVDTEIPTETAGFVRAILVAEGDTAPVGAPVAVLTATADEAFDLPASGPSTPTDHQTGGNLSPAVAPSTADAPARDSDSGLSASSASGLSASAPSASAPSASAPSVSRPTPPTSASDRSRGQERDAGSGETEGQVLSPVVRRLLAEHDLDPTRVSGSGRDGRITRADVLAAATAARTAPAGHADQSRAVSPSGPSTPSTPAAPSVDADRPATDRPGVDGSSATGSSAVAASPVPHGTPPAGGGAVPSEETVLEPGDEVVDLSRARLATAENLSRSLATAAHALVVNEVDYSNVEAARRSAGLSYLPFVARAAIDAIREFPHVNASLQGSSLVVRRAVHLGVAVDVDREALMVPVIRDADGLRIGAIAAAVSDLADRARHHRLSGDALGGGTFTLTNVGAHGTLLAAPIINWPQVAILSTDGVRMAPTAVRTDDGGEVSEWGIAVHPLGNLSLSFDHRAFDGAYAAAFLARVREILQTRDWTKEVGAP